MITNSRLTSWLYLYMKKKNKTNATRMETVHSKKDGPVCKQTVRPK